MTDSPSIDISPGAFMEVTECKIDCGCITDDDCPFVELPDGQGWTTKQAVIEHVSEVDR